MKRTRNTEVDAYIFIKETLDSLGWNIKNPSRNAEGEVYTQNECQDQPEIKKYLGRLTPENVVKLSETKFWIIESKKEHKQLQQALDEAKNDYALKVNQSSQISAVLISGVAGNRTDSYFVENEYFDGKKWHKVTINGKKASGLLSPEEVRIIIAQNSGDIKDIVIDEKLFLERAEKINEILHLGAINKNYRARVMAAILLSLVDDTPPNIDQSPIGLIRDINSRVENVLEKEKKGSFASQIKIELPPSTDNHVKFKKALVNTIQELNLLNIRSAMNSGTDVLGKFYEVFLKYGNGAKEIGIVLTPRHITQYSVSVLNIEPNDIVFDPTCGTGGFLVAAFDYVKNKANKKQIEKFKQKNIFGIDQEPPVVALAIVNMIFRGDGKNNIIEGDCFKNNLVASGGDTAKYIQEYREDEQAVTKVLMNPPFALKSSDDKEYKFIDYALRQMQDGGTLFSVLPYSAMSKSSGYDVWRKNLVQKNTVLSVVTFPQDLFYPIGVFTIGVFIKKGIPHPKNQSVLWVRAMTDGYTKRKGKRLPNEKAENFLSASRDLVASFIANPKINIKGKPKLIKSGPINFSDPRLELVPEVYLDDNDMTVDMIEKEMRYLIKEVASFKIKFSDVIHKK